MITVDGKGNILHSDLVERLRKRFEELEGSEEIEKKIREDIERKRGLYPLLFDLMKDDVTAFLMRESKKAGIGGRR